MLSVYLYLHFRQSLISVAVCIFEYRHWKGKGFGAEYSPQEEDSARNGLPLRPFNFQGLLYYLRRRAKERGEWRNLKTHIYRRLMIDQIKFYPAIMKNAPSFCSFIKKLYLCSKMSCTSMQITQVCRNQNSCQLITSFLNFPHKLFILSGLWDYSKNTPYFSPTQIWAGLLREQKYELESKHLLMYGLFVCQCGYCFGYK